LILVDDRLGSPATMTQTFVLILFVLILWVAAWHVRSVQARQALLLVASYAFYLNWGFGFLSVLIISSLMNYVCGLALRRKASTARLSIGIALNLLLLGVFKYLPSLLKAWPAGSWQGDLARHIIMPVGMSFWTFQGLSYLWDIYLGEELDPSLLEFCLYMAFWPTVVSGPVCRLPNMLPQFREEPVLSPANISAGTLLVIQGLFMKMCLAQLLGSGWRPGGGVTAGFDQMRAWGGVDVWLLGIGFGFQLFFDFAGYSLIVIGVARAFGIRLADNFDRPFLSVSPSIFWTRWHMSLSFWIRDYVFTPLAAAGRRYRWWPYVVFVISMTLFGLWHGPKWTFVAYGVYHGVLLVMTRLGLLLKRRFPIRPPRYVGVFLAWGTTFLLVSLGFVIFRANNLTHALSMVGAVVSPSAYRLFAMPRTFYLLIPAAALAYFIVTAGQLLLRSWRARYRAALSEPTPSGDLSPAGVRTFTVMMGALAEFFAATLWWWLAPTLSIVALFIGLVIYGQNTVIAVTPFIYTLF
jgi:alginate O-acetyltransferase complex protein AlgI